MKIALDLDVQLKDGILILKESSGRTLIFPKDHMVPKKIQMVTLAELSDLTIEQICELFGYKTRKSYYDIRRFVLRRRGFPQTEIQENYRTIAKSWSNNHPAGPSSVCWGQTGNAPLGRCHQGTKSAE